MFATCLFSARLYGQLCRQSLSRGGDFSAQTWGGWLVRLILFLLFLPVWLLHWLGLLLDEVLFPGYRTVVVRQPVFILGVPRSGTTFLHRTLAADTETFTTVSTWEVFFAPSITQRMVWRGVGTVDRWLGRPLGRLIEWLEVRAFKRLEGVHDVSLAAAEEDYLLLLPILSCFILLLPFTGSDYIWRLSRFDWDMPEPERARILAFYRAGLQKHLFFHGTERCFLSKNAAFASWTNSLYQTFPDARFVFCLREPEKAVPSLFGSLESGALLFQLDLNEGELPRRLIEMMRLSYRHPLVDAEPAAPKVHMAQLQNDLQGIVEALYRTFDIPLSAAYLTRLQAIEADARQYRSKSNHMAPSHASEREYYEANFPWYYEWEAGVAADHHPAPGTRVA